MSRTMKIRKLKLFYFKKNARYRAKKLCRDIFLGNLSLNEGKISEGPPGFDFRILVTSRENQELFHSVFHPPFQPLFKGFLFSFLTVPDQLIWWQQLPRLSPPLSLPALQARGKSIWREKKKKKQRGARGRETRDVCFTHVCLSLARVATQATPFPSLVFLGTQRWTGAEKSNGGSLISSRSSSEDFCFFSQTDFKTMGNGMNKVEFMICVAFIKWFCD